MPSSSSLYDRPDDLCNDDDFLAHVLLDSLALPGHTRLGVHYASAAATVPDYDQREVLDIVAEYVCRRASAPKALVHLLNTPPFKRYLATLSEGELRARAFKTHALYYLNLYLPQTPLEIGPTPRYTAITLKTELGVFASAPIARWTVLRAGLAGNTAPLGREEEEELTGSDSEMGFVAGGRGGVGGGRAKKDFSVVFNDKRKLNDLFLGPARFLNHDCEPNCELTRQGSGPATCISFRTKRPIAPGEELTAFYSRSYFGPDNSDCMCATCERLSRGFYAPRPSADRLLKPGKRASDLLPPQHLQPPHPHPLPSPSPDPTTPSSSTTTTTMVVGGRGGGAGEKDEEDVAELLLGSGGGEGTGDRGSSSSTRAASRTDEEDDDEQEEEEEDGGSRRRRPTTTTTGRRTGSPWCPDDGASTSRSLAGLPVAARRTSSVPTSTAGAVGGSATRPGALSAQPLSASTTASSTSLLTAAAAAAELHVPPCPVCQGHRPLTAPINGHVVRECTRCWRHRTLHALPWPAKAPTVGRSTLLARLGPGPLTDTEDGVFYGPAWAAEDSVGEEEEEEEDASEEGRQGEGGVRSEDELAVAGGGGGGGKRKAREWELEPDAFEIREKADYKHGLTFCYARVRGITLSRTLDEENLPIVNLSSLLKLAGFKDGPELRGRLYVDPPDAAAPTVRRRWLFKGVWVQREYAVQIARELGLHALLERFLEPQPRLGWPVNPCAPSLRGAIPPPFARRLGPTPSVASSAAASDASGRGGLDELDEVDPCLGRPTDLDESELPPLPKSEFPLRPKVALPPPASQAVAGTPALRVYAVEFPIHRCFYQCEPSTLDGRTVVVQRDERSHWLNLTAILRLAGLDSALCSRVYASLKPTREKWLYGALAGEGTWEGVWAPLSKGRELARRYGVDHLLHPTILLDRREFLEAIGDDVAPILVDMLGRPLPEGSMDEAVKAEPAVDDGMDADDDADSDDELPLVQVLSAKSSMTATVAPSSSSPPPPPPVRTSRSGQAARPSPVRPTSCGGASRGSQVKRIRLAIKPEPVEPSASGPTSSRLSSAAAAGRRNMPIPYSQPDPAAAVAGPRRKPRPPGRSVPSFRPIVKAEPQASPPKKVPPPQVINFRKIQRPLPADGAGPGPSLVAAEAAAHPPPPTVGIAAAVPAKLEDASSGSIQFVGQARNGTSDKPIDLCDSSEDDRRPAAPARRVIPPAAPPAAARPIGRPALNKSPSRPRPVKSQSKPRPVKSRALAPPTPAATRDKGKARATSASAAAGPTHVSLSFRPGSGPSACAEAAAAAAAAVVDDDDDEALRQLGLAGDDAGVRGSSSEEDDDEPVVIQMTRMQPIEVSDGDSDDPICTGRHVRVARVPRRFTPTLTGGGADSPIELDDDDDDDG